MADMPARRAPRNPADLLNLGRDRALSRLLRACGADEASITGGASDYGKFLALAANLPLCEGHPLRDQVNAALSAATGLSAPLCPHTARGHWNAWAEKHWYGNSAPPPQLPKACPLCPPAKPTILRMSELISLPHPTAVKGSDLAAWSQALQNALPTDGSPAVYVLPTDYTFVRPNPYHAGLAVGKLARGEELTEKERDLLVAQALRVWGLALVGKEPDTTPLLLLCGGSPEAVTALLAYLEVSKALPAMVWIPDDPTHAGSVSGLYPQVGTGYDVAEGDPVEAVEGKKTAYAKAAPIGRAILLVISIQSKNLES